MFQVIRKLFTSKPTLQETIWNAHLGHEIEETKAKYLLSPDHQDLMSKERHIVFIYNECQKGQRAFKTLGLYDNRLIGYGAESDVVKLGSGFTLDQFLLYKKRLGKETFPFALKIAPNSVRGGFKGAFPHKISGQIFLLKPSCIIELDTYMLNTVQFKRKKVIIEAGYRKRDMKTNSCVFGEPQKEQIEAFMYVGKADFWLEQISVQPERYGVCREYLTNDGKDGGKPDYYYFFNGSFESKE